jgi:DNA invertase Pin-like site-specific DNA recombinase
MKVIGYIRVSTDEQDADNQKHRLNDYAQQKQWVINEFIEVEISSRKNTRERRIDELRAKLAEGDTLLVTELSRLGRNMLETLSIITELGERGIKIIFVNQPEASTAGPHTKLLLAIYSYFAEAERDYISMHTKQALQVRKDSGRPLGRPKGSKNRNRVLDPYKDQIKGYLEMGLTLTSIRKVINNQLEQPISYNSYKYFVQREEEPNDLWQAQRQKEAIR